jgi:hypothetical protein
VADTAPARTRQASPTLVVTVLVVVSVSAGLLSELGRRMIKGAEYASVGWFDYHYYMGMAVRLWQAPMGLVDEVAWLGLDVDPRVLTRYYGSTLHEAYLHAVNGVSHQPPYAYRVLQPTLAGLIGDTGLPLYSAYLALYVIGICLLAVFAYAQLSPGWRVSLRAAVVTSGLVVAVLATSRPVIPDALFLGLAMLAVWAAARQRPALFACAAGAAMAARETAVVLVVVWLAYAWSMRRRRPLALLLPAATPLVVFVLVRLAVHVPDPDVDYLGLVRMLASGEHLLVAVMSLLTIGLVSPLATRYLDRGARSALSRPELVTWVAAVAYALATMAIVTAVARMALLVLPLLVAPSGWIGARSRLWALAAIVATYGYAAADTLAERQPAPFGPYPWVVTAALVVGLQVAALRSDRRAGGRTPSPGSAP